ncbi:MAG: hemerythrin domain-containing protein [Burkholderiaceae bacterium]|jgi:iron-sulfur cluster repair protein YtfE (RIC family)
MKAKARATEGDLASMDTYHRQVRDHLDRLAALATRVEGESPGEETRAEAGAIEGFFSESMREHHLAEELFVFPPLLDSGDDELVTGVHTLQQDHGWMEQNWIEIAPQLRAIAQGNHWIDPAEFMHGVEVFLELSYGHTALEELLLHSRALKPAEAPATLQVANVAR